MGTTPGTKATWGEAYDGGFPLISSIAIPRGGKDGVVCFCFGLFVVTEAW